MKTVDPLRRLRDPLDMEGYIKGMEAEIARLTTERSHLVSQCHDLDEMLKDKEAEVKSAQAVCDSYAKENQQFHDEIDRLTNERDIAVKERSNAREQVYAANDQIDRLTWQSIDTVPKDGSEVLLCILGNTQVVAFWDDEAKTGTHRWQTADGIAYHDEAPTHWMPLPELPKPK